MRPLYYHQTEMYRSSGGIRFVLEGQVSQQLDPRVWGGAWN
jgi:hypothetical protein